ncbi:MAG: DUF2461 domain-containing protein [Planctomycetes bacterium]|nr:DUF2461 domain-containing protein [Planctomycetota bacterium]MBL7146257.1 DUF2461 domain-containing protein [Phycisphaerae bacterium]
MTEREGNSFMGFSPKTLKFLRGLEANNNKAWFQVHRADYEEYVLQPLRDLVMDLGDFMLDIDPSFEITPAVNKTISKIYRDTRFSKDKSSFRSTVWFTFKNQKKDWTTHVCGYFFELSVNSYRYGMGFYNAASAIMSRFREMIDDNPKEFLKAISFFDKQKTFVLEGEKYKRVIDKTKPEIIQNWYQRRNMYLVCNRKIDDALFSNKLVDDLACGFDMIAPFYNYLQKIKLQSQH